MENLYSDRGALFSAKEAAVIVGCSLAAVYKGFYELEPIRKNPLMFDLKTVEKAKQLRKDKYLV